VTSLFDSAEFNARLFFPRRDATPCPPGARDLLLPVGEGVVLHARAHPDPRARATLVVFHGNGEVVADYDPLAPQFHAIGASLVAIDFRGYGLSSGAPTLRAAIEDAAPAVREVLGRCTPTGPVAVFGRSLGGSCAAEIAGRDPPLVAGLVLESAAVDLAGLVARRGLPVPARFTPEEAAVFDPLPKLARCRLPALVLHGGADTLVVPHEARSSLEALAGDDKRLVLLPNRGHNDLWADPGYWSALESFVHALASC
jgi:alpha-beta hydrolase superfamily lysophospholipase